MALTLPNITIEGTLTADPEVRYTPQGTAVANVTIASNSRRKNEQTGQWENGDATFIRGSAWKKLAENIAESLTKGTRVIAYGTLKQRDYEKDGVKRTAYEMNIEGIGPSLAFATTHVSKNSATGSAQSSAGNGWDDSETNGWG